MPPKIPMQERIGAPLDSGELNVSGVEHLSEIAVGLAYEATRPDVSRARPVDGATIVSLFGRETMPAEAERPIRPQDEASDVGENIDAMRRHCLNRAA